MQLYFFKLILLTTILAGFTKAETTHSDDQSPIETTQNRTESINDPIITTETVQDHSEDINDSIKTTEIVQDHSENNNVPVTTTETVQEQNKGIPDSVKTTEIIKKSIKKDNYNNLDITGQSTITTSTIAANTEIFTTALIETKNNSTSVSKKSEQNSLIYTCAGITGVLVLSANLFLVYRIISKRRNVNMNKSLIQIN